MDLGDFECVGSRRTGLSISETEMSCFCQRQEENEQTSLRSQESSSNSNKYNQGMSNLEPNRLQD